VKGPGAVPMHKKKSTGPPPKTACTVTLHGPGFRAGREDVVLEACQDVAFVEGISWPDYAVVVQANLCHVEWPDPEVAATFCKATGHTMKIEEKSFTVKLHVEAATASSSAAEAGAEAETLSDGARVQIRNLTGAKELNGKFAKVSSFNETTGRYIVCLEEDVRIQKSLKPDNLRSVGPELAAAKSKAAPPKPSASAAYAEGTRVVIDNLTGKDKYEIGATDLDGKVAVIKSFDKDSGRYSVELEDQKGIEYKKLRPVCLTPVDDGLTELERAKRKAVGGGNNDVQDALKGVNGDMWANFVNMFGNEPDSKKQKM